jgi:hypothetical protein
LILIKVCFNKLHHLKLECNQCLDTLHELLNKTSEFSNKLKALKTHKIPGLNEKMP